MQDLHVREHRISNGICPACGEPVDFEEFDAETHDVWLNSGLCLDCQMEQYGG